MKADLLTERKVQTDLATARKPVDLTRFEESLKIVRTGKASDGTSYNGIGTLNQAAWIGECSGVLIEEIKFLRPENAALNAVAEAAKNLRESKSDDVEEIGLLEMLLDNALANLAAIQKGSK